MAWLNLKWRFEVPPSDSPRSTEEKKTHTHTKVAEHPGEGGPAASSGDGVGAGALPALHHHLHDVTGVVPRNEGAIQGHVLLVIVAGSPMRPEEDSASAVTYLALQWGQARKRDPGVVEPASDLIQTVDYHLFD